MTFRLDDVGKERREQPGRSLGTSLTSITKVGNMPHLLSPRRPRGRPGERRGDAALPGGGSKRENPSNRRPHRPDTRARSRSVGSTGSTGSNSSNVSIQKERRAAAPGLHLELLRTIKVTEKGSPRPPTSRSRSSRHLSRGSQSGSDELSKGERQQGVPNLRRLSVVVRTSCRSPGPHLSDSVLNASSALRSCSVAPSSAAALQPQAE